MASSPAWFLAIFLAVINDIGDIVLEPTIVGEIAVDVLTVLAIYALTREWITIAGLAKVIPGIDLLPYMTPLVVVAWWRQRGQGDY